LDEVPYINCPKLSQGSKHHLQLFVSPLQERLNLGFLIEGKLAAILIIPSSWGFQWAGHSPHTRTVCSHVNYTQQLIFWHHCRGGSRRLLRGEFFARTSFTLLLLCFTLFILPASFYIKKPKKIRILGSCYFFTFSLSWWSLSTFWRTSQ
jgi:hypothetical protein